MNQEEEEVAKEFLSGKIVPDGDAVAGIDRETSEKTVTYELERMAGQLSYLAHVAVRGALPVVHECPENESILIFNKCYGMDLDIPIKNQPDEKESLHVFSAFLSKPTSRKQLKRTFFAKKLVYMPTYGGIVVGADGTVQQKPCIMDVDTREIMFSSDMGWRSLLYKNKGPDDPHPTGIVAIEGWKFDISRKNDEYEASKEDRTRAYYALHRTILHHYEATTTKAQDGADK